MYWKESISPERRRSIPERDAALDFGDVRDVQAMTEEKTRRVRFKRERDNKIGEAMQHNYARGFRDGVEKGAEEGRMAGFAHGIKQGRTEGIAEQKRKEQHAQEQFAIPLSLRPEHAGDKYAPRFALTQYLSFLQQNANGLSIDHRQTAEGETLVSMFTVASQHVAGKTFFEAVDQAIMTAVARKKWNVERWERIE